MFFYIYIKVVFTGTWLVFQGLCSINVGKIYYSDVGTHSLKIYILIIKKTRGNSTSLFPDETVR